MSRTIETAAAEYAKAAIAEIIANPSAYGVDEKWESVREYIDFEFNGDASDEAKRLGREFGLPYKEAAEALEAAFRAKASLSELNEPFGEDDED